MSLGTDTLLTDLLDLAKAQRAALREGKLDEAIELGEERGVIAEGISVFESVPADGPPPVSAARGKNGGRDQSTEGRREAIGEILLVDQDISEAVLDAMAEVAAKLDGIDKLKRFFRNSSTCGKDKNISIKA